MEGGMNPALKDKRTASPHDRRPRVPNAPHRLGRVARKVRRLLIVVGNPLTTGELARNVYGAPIRRWHYARIRLAARKFAVEVGRRRSAGAPIVWRLK
jgi:hypothetical protein